MVDLVMELFTIMERHYYYNGVSTKAYKVCCGLWWLYVKTCDNCIVVYFSLSFNLASKNLNVFILRPFLNLFTMQNESVDINP